MLETQGIDFEVETGRKIVKERMVCDEVNVQSAS
jgi:hypothetical protein